MSAREEEADMKRTAYRTAVLLVALIALTSCTRTQEGKVPRNTLATPEETVKAYCDLDANAARLTSDTWPRVRPYIAWDEEAGWDRTVVIAGFTITNVRKRSDSETVVTVDYQVTGILSGDYLPSRKTETVKFTVKRTEEGWKITSPDFMPPHVLMKPLIAHLEETRNLELAGTLKDAPKDVKETK
jgi:hypothetical protein